MEDQTETLEKSIRELGEETFAATPSGIRHPVYLDPRGWRVYPSTHVGPGMPMPAWEGRHPHVCDVPPGAIPASVVEQLLRHLDTLAEACVEADHDWEDDEAYMASATYRLGAGRLDLDIACEWHPADWFEPCRHDIRAYAEEGLDVSTIVDRIGLEADGWQCVDTEAAIEWIAEFIRDGIEAGEIELPEPKPCYGCGQPLPSVDDVFCDACGGPER